MRSRRTTIGIAACISVTIIVGSIIAFLQPSTPDRIGVIGIAATVIVGIAIFWMQQKADQNVNGIIHHEDERKKSIKRYFIRRIDADFRMFSQHTDGLKQSIRDYKGIGQRSDESWVKLTRTSDRYITQVDSFVKVTDDITPIVPLLDNPYLIDKYHNFVIFGEQLKTYAKEVSELRNRSEK